ncbi:MAG: hypothetical protein ACLGHL_03555 [Actinomycetota bacterium]
MLKKLIACALVVGLMTAVVGPAGAKKKKSKGPKPYKSEEVTIQVGHPVFYGQTGSPKSVTAMEFEQNCAIPSSNGFDAYFFEVPETYHDVEATISSYGSAGPEGYDLDIYLYDENCKVTIAFNSTSLDETGILTKGTRYIMIHNYTGGPTQAYFELKV